MKKNPVVAAILNFMVFGGGYLYLGKRALPALLITVGGTTAQVIEIMVSPVAGNNIPALWPFLLAGLVAAKVGLAIDAFQLAKEA